MAELTRLSRADQALINAAAALVMPVTISAEDSSLLLAVMGEVQPHCNADHTQLRGLILQAAVLTRPVLQPEARRDAEYRMREELARFFKWRCGAALEQFKAAQGAAA